MKRSRSVGGAQRCLMDHGREGLAARWGRGPSWRLQRAMDMGVLPTARHGDGGAAAGGGGKALSGDAHGDRACSAVWWLRPCRSAAELLPVAIGGLNNNGGCIKREKIHLNYQTMALKKGTASWPLLCRKEVGVDCRFHHARARRSSCAPGQGESPMGVGRAGTRQASRRRR